MTIVKRDPNWPTRSLKRQQERKELTHEQRSQAYQLEKRRDAYRKAKGLVKIQQLWVLASERGRIQRECRELCEAIVSLEEIHKIK